MEQTNRVNKHIMGGREMNRVITKNNRELYSILFVEVIISIFVYAKKMDAS